MQAVFTKMGHRRKREIRSPRYSTISFAIALLVSLFCLTDSGWVDPDTPEELYTTLPLAKGDEREFRLVCMNGWMHVRSFVRLIVQAMLWCHKNAKPIDHQYSQLTIFSILGAVL